MNGTRFTTGKRFIDNRVILQDMLALNLIRGVSRSAGVRFLQTSPIVWSKTAEGAKGKDKDAKSGVSRKDLIKQFGPKRPAAAFILYTVQERANATAENPGLSTKEISAVLGEKWRQLSEYEKEPYFQKTQQALEEYKTKKQEFEATLPPKKPLSPFLLFSNEVREEIKSQNPSLSFGDLASLIGRRWKSLGEYEKKKYYDRYAENKSSWEQEVQRKLQNFKL